MRINKKICFASVDVEHDFREKDKFYGVESLGSILDIFKKHNIPATFFVTGAVLQRYTDSAKEWGANYEIACHTLTHRFWNTLNVKERGNEIDGFFTLYQGIFQKLPIGFRAPSHIIDDEGIKLLEEKGFSYDSSIVPHYPPFKKYRGHKGRRPLLPYYPKDRKILEIPIRGQVFGIPLAGAWIKKLPSFFYKILFSVYSPSFITLNMHSWDTLNPQFLNKLDKLLKLLKDENYRFLNGEQIFQNRE